MKCMVCESENVDIIETVISGFLAEKVFGKTENERMPVKLIHCKECGFGYYDKRLSSEESAKLYEGYRSAEYQKMRQKHDVWYTPKINEAIGNNEKQNISRNRYMSDLFLKYMSLPIGTALDFGGDKGQYYPSEIPIINKYVYDISGVEACEGVTSFRSLAEASAVRYDMIMCNHVLEHVADIQDIMLTIYNLGNKDTNFYFEVPFDSPFYSSFASNFKFLFNPYFTWPIILKHFIKIKRQKAFVPMTEHINYFTIESLECLLTRTGYKILNIQTNELDAGWTTGKVISAVCKRA